MHEISPSEIQLFPLKCILAVMYELASKREIQDLPGDGLLTPVRCLLVLSSAPFSDQGETLNFKHLTCTALTFRVCWEQNLRILGQGPMHRGGCRVQEPGGVPKPDACAGAVPQFSAGCADWGAQHCQRASTGPGVAEH